VLYEVQYFLGTVPTMVEVGEFDLRGQGASCADWNQFPILIPTTCKLNGDMETGDWEVGSRKFIMFTKDQHKIDG